MKPILTTAFWKILALRKRLRVVQGSSSAGKTIAILMILIDRAGCEKNKLFSVVSETIPHLKKGAIRDFLNIMEAQNYYDDNAWNRTDFIYTFPTGSKIEFFSADSPDKVRGPRRNVLFINEANNISYETYTQLAIRTSEEIYIDYNPVAEFWVNDEILDAKDQETGEPLVEHDFLIVTYKDNEALPPTVVAELESRKKNAGWWKVYGEGQLGSAEGVIYPRWPQVDLPDGARLERRGVDFGFTNDPTAIVDVYYYDQGYILDEVLFQKGVSGRQIADTILAQEHKVLTIADSADPRLIEEIRSYGINIMPATKGQGSVLQGIQLVQDQNISVTKRSINIIKANKNYVWDTDVNGKPTNTPDHFWSDAMDAVRYALTSIVPVKTRQEQINRMPSFFKKTRTNPAR